MRLAQHYDAEIQVHCGGVAARARSFLDLMGLVADFGMFLELEAQGPDAEAAVDALAELLSARPAEGEG
ncbi:MAG: HPr family phosphocarrier protein [Isosphaeraceae bacterium]